MEKRTAVSQTGLQNFCRHLAQDVALLDRLGGILDWKAFGDAFVQAGRIRGAEFTAAEVETALRQPFRLDDLMVAAIPFVRWVPTGLVWNTGTPTLEWDYVGSHRFTEPFLEDTLRTCRYDPLGRLLGFRCTIHVLEEMAEQPSLAPNGFLFHMSRCGSTLIAQMLAASPQNVVLSEPELIDAVLSARAHDPVLTEEQQVIWLRGAIHTLGQKRHPEEHRFFIKFDSWHILSLPLIRRAFPDVPWIFVYRNPVEVLVSHSRQPGKMMVPGLLPDFWFRTDDTVWAMNLEEYGANVLARICQAALEECRVGGGHLVEYRELPEAVWTVLPSVFGVEFSPQERAQMQPSIKVHAKRPTEMFIEDAQTKQERANADLCRLAADMIEPQYEELECLRAGQKAQALVTSNQKGTDV